MWAILGAALQIFLLLLQRWFKYSDEKKEKVKEILKESKGAKDASTITRVFDRINSL